MSNFGFVNIITWVPDQVISWLKGLDDILDPYCDKFQEAEINGPKLLSLTHGDLCKIGVEKLGHQELILEAVELLLHMHYQLDNETLQSLALQLECRSRCLHNEVRGYIAAQERAQLDNPRWDQQTLPFPVLFHIADLIDVIKSLVSWLDRSPFEGASEYRTKRDKFVKFGLELVSAAQGDNVADSQDAVMAICKKLWLMCEAMIQNCSDPLMIQPAVLELATMRKKPEDELGMHIQSSCNGTHVISGIKPGSPADICNKVEVGDEVIQVNYQTVVGWQLKKLVAALKENKKEVILTVKKRPHHTNIYGAAVNKRRNQQKLGQSTFPKAMSKRKSRGERGGRASIKDLLDMPPGAATEPIVEPVKEILSDNEADNENGNDDNDNVFRSGSESPGFSMVQSLPVFEEKQRRATVSGGSPVMQRPSINGDFPESGRPKSYTITVSSPSSEGSGYPSIDLTSPSLDTYVLESPVKSSITKEDAGNDVKGEKEICVSTVVITPPTEPPMTSPAKCHRSELTIQLNESPKRRRKIVTEVPGTSEDKGSPQLNKVTRIDSNRRAELAAEEKQIGHAAVDIDSNAPDDRPQSLQAYVVKVVGGIPQKVPVAQKDSPTQSPSSLLRRKNIMRRMVPNANRRVSCKDLGKGECQGWLWKKKETKGSRMGSKWSKLWFVLKQQNLYYYKDPEISLQAMGLIHLPGFQVSPAPEIKTKKFAFKAHHSGTTFYFGADRQDDMSKWMNKMGLAAIVYDMKDNPTTAGFIKPDDAITNMVIENAGYYSESEDESALSSPNTPDISDREGSKEDLAESHEDELVESFKSIKRVLNVDGTNRKMKRESAMQPASRLHHLPHIDELEYGKKLSSLQRTLKSKEDELAEIEKLLRSSRITHEKLLSSSIKLHLSPSDASSDEDEDSLSPLGAAAAARDSHC